MPWTTQVGPGTRIIINGAEISLDKNVKLRVHSEADIEIRKRDGASLIKRRSINTQEEKPNG